MTKTTRMKTAAISGVSLLALGVGGALAQVVTDYDLGVPTADLSNYMLFGLNQQFEDAPVTGEISGSTQMVTGPNDGSNVTVDSNAFQVSAIGNLANTTVADAVGGSAVWGHRILSEQIVAGTTVSASSSGNLTGAQVTGFLTGNLTVTNNSTAATATVNRASNQLIGLPSIDGDPLAGSVTGGFTSGNIAFQISDAHSSIANVQLSNDVTASATVDGADGGIRLVDDVVGDIDATLSVTGNSIGASLTGNDGSNAILDPVDVGYAGSLAIANAQANIGGDYTTSVTDQQISALIIGDSTLSGVLTVSENRIGADATGNVVTNQIGFGDGVSVVGEHDRASIQMSDDGSSFTVTDFAADFGIVSAQGNIGTPVDATVTNGNISAAGVGLGLPGGTLTVSGNTVDATAAGSLSSHSIIADGPEFSASVAIAGFQSNDGSPVSALVDSSTVGAVAGDLSLGAVLSVADNTVDASATGNQSSTSIALEAEHLDVRAGGLTSLGGDASTDFGSITGSHSAGAFGGVLATNLQSIYGGSDVNADVTGTGIGLSAGNIDASTVALNDNSINAAATGNESATTIQLTGVDGHASAGVGNVQISEALVSGTVTGGMVAMSLGDATNATVSLSDNMISAGATANTAANTLLATGFSTLTTANGSSIYIPYGTFVVDSSQEVREDVTAIIQPGTGPSQIVADVNSGIDNSVVAISDNTMQAAATGNAAGNTLWIDAVVLENRAPGSSDLLGRIANDQSVVGADITASVLGHEIGLGFEDVTDSTLAVTGNSAIAAADGSFASNQLLVTGTTHVGVYDAASTADGVEFLVQSIQTAVGGGSITAQVSDVGIGAGGDTVTADGTSLVSSDNSLVAQARSNVAINTLNLGVNNGDSGFSSLTTSALIDNSQESDASVSATVAAGRIGLELASSTGSTQTVSDNSMDALALGNASDNRMNIAAVDLQGGASELSDDFHVLNSQSNAGAITASVTGGQVGINTDGVGQTISDGGSANVLNNGVSATGFGNNAGNHLTMASIDGSFTGGVSNIQSNSGAVTASVTGLSIGVVTAGGTSANTTVQGNGVNATAVGNSAVNSVTRSSY